MSTKGATVFVVDDDASVRKALARSIQAAGLNAKLFASAREFLDQNPPEGPGCLVLDIHMPGLSGLGLQTELNSRNIQTPIVFMTGHGSIPATVRAMKGGAVDFLTKPFKPKDLLAVIKEALKKDERLQVARMERAGIQARIQSLTPREREVLGLVVKGLLNKQIAVELGAAERTVKVHRGRMMHKMRVQSVAELVHAMERATTEGGSLEVRTTKVS